MTVIVIITLIVLCVLVIFEFATFATYGPPINSDLNDAIINGLGDYRLNTISWDILSGNRKPYITNIGATFLFSHHINGVGIVWRFSTLSKAINKRFKELLTESFKN